MATVPEIKLDDDAAIKAEPDIDFDGPSPAPIPDDDAYEDTGELEIPKELGDGWLLRVPPTLYENWSKLEMDDPVEIGFIRQYKDGSKSELHLHRNVKEHKKVPKVYDMLPQGKDGKDEKKPQNTFVFTEKDLPGYKPRSSYENRSAQGEVKKEQQTERNRRYQPYFRRAIPKQTTLAAVVNREGVCKPVDNEEYRQLMKDALLQQQANRKDMSLLTGDVRQYSGMVLGGPVSRAPNEGGFESFVRTGGQASRQKKSENKYVRVDRDTLLNNLFECFSEFRYWRMRELKVTLRQPEAYIKENLTEVADLIRAGDFAGCYRLKPEVEKNNIKFYENAKDEAAPAAPENVKDEESDDDEDIQMEDALEVSKA